MGLCAAVGAPARPALAAPAEDRDAFDPETARRYREILERDPGGEAVYRRLVEHYGRGPGLSALIRHYEGQAGGEGKSAFAVRLLLGKLYRSAGRFDEAQGELEAAAALDAKSPLPVMALAEMARRRRTPDRASKLYETALGLTTSRERRETVLKVLADMALDARDLPRATSYLERLQKERPGDAFLQAEVARIYAGHGALEPALQQWRSILKRSAGNRREEVRCLKEIGGLLGKLDRPDEAEAAYRRALSMVSSDNWNVGELRERLVEIHRGRDELRELLAQFERTWKRRGFDEWLMLAKLHEELGREDKAVAAYRKAIALRRKDPSVRLALIRLFERLGRVDDVVAEYKRLIASAPAETRYQIELADLLYRRQEPTRALKMLDGIAKRYGADSAVIGSLADAYTRYGENERALKAYQKLVRREAGEESHLISLGEQHALMGDMVEARKAWRTVLQVMNDQGAAWHLLGETYGAHDLPEEAVDAYKKAVAARPADVRMLRSLALALERTERQGEAVAAWEQVHALAKDARGRKEARQWLVRLYRGRKMLATKTEQWRQLFERSDVLRRRLEAAAEDEREVLVAEIAQTEERGLEAGRLLADGLMKLNRQEDGEAVLRRILERAPTDIDSLEALEELYLSRNELRRAIEILTQIAELNPYRAREYYQRVAEYSLRQYNDEDAVRFAGLAVDINPDDSLAHARLARIYYRMQDLEAAAVEYRKAVDLDRLNFEACFELARVLRDLGRMAEADAQYRDVVKRAQEDDMVLKAARKSLHLNLMSGGLEDLERDLLPLLWRSPPKPVFRRVVTELYGHLVWPLRNQVRFARGEDAEAARKRLTEIGERAVKPLLEALTDDDSGLRMSALDVLADLGHGDAAIPLGRLLDEREPRVRVRAAVALGRIGDERGVGALKRGIRDGDQGVRAASAWALGSIGGRKATAALLTLVDPASPDRKWPVRAVAAAALGRAGDRRAVPILADLVGADGATGPRGADSKEEVRAAAAWALGRLDADRAQATLLTSLELDTLLVRRIAARGLANRPGRGPTEALLAALWTGEAPMRAAALAALAGEGPGEPDDPGTAPGFIDLGAGAPDARHYVLELAKARSPLRGPEGARSHAGAAAARAAQILEATPELLAQAVAEALDSDEPEVVRQILRDLDARQDGPALGPLTSGELPTAVLTRLADALSEGGSPVLQSLESLATESESHARGRELRATALSVLGKIAATTSDRQVAAGLAGVFDSGLGDTFKEVRRAAVQALGRTTGSNAASDRAIPLLQKALTDSAWSVRAQAVDALASQPPDAAGASLGSLASALRDPFPYVRTAAARGLGRLQSRPTPPSTIQALTEALTDRAGPVRAAAAEALGQLGDASAVPALRALRSDQEILVREAAAAAIARLAP